MGISDAQGLSPEISSMSWISCGGMDSSEETCVIAPVRSSSEEMFQNRKTTASLMMQL